MEMHLVPREKRVFDSVIGTALWEGQRRQTLTHQSNSMAIGDAEFRPCWSILGQDDVLMWLEQQMEACRQRVAQR